MTEKQGQEAESLRIQRVVWTCPICGTAKEKFVQEGRHGSPGENDLKAHLRMTDGDGHGSFRQLPEIQELDSLEEYIEMTECQPE